MSRILFWLDEESAPAPAPALVPSTKTGAISSAIQLGDIALTWSLDLGDADMSLIDDDLASDRGLLTATLLSLALDRRAETDDMPPSGNSQDRRGWWADQFAAIVGDKYGSRLWLLDRSTITSETRLRAEEYAREALQWQIDDRVVESIDLDVDLTKTGYVISGDLNRPGRDPVSFRFAHTWDHLQEDL